MTACSFLGHRFDRAAIRSGLTAICTRCGLSGRIR